MQCKLGEGRVSRTRWSGSQRLQRGHRGGGQQKHLLTLAIKREQCHRADHLQSMDLLASPSHSFSFPSHFEAKQYWEIFSTRLDL